MNKILIIASKSAFAFAGMLLSLVPLFGQELEKPKWRFSELYIYGGGQGSVADEQNPDNFFILAPSSQILEMDISGYSSGFVFGNFGPKFSVLAGFNREDLANKGNQLTLRAGLSYRNVQPAGARLYRSDRIRYDTLMSASSGSVLYADSVTTRDISMSHISEQIRLDLSAVYRLFADRRFSLYTGFGIGIGVSLNARTEIDYTITRSVELSSPALGRYTTGPVFMDDFDFAHERFANKTHLAAAFYIPLGWDWRLGSKSEFWKMISIFSEYQPHINITSIPELKTIAGVGMSGSIGLRLSNFR